MPPRKRKTTKVATRKSAGAAQPPQQLGDVSKRRRRQHQDDDVDDNDVAPLGRPTTAEDDEAAERHSGGSSSEEEGDDGDDDDNNVARRGGPRRISTARGTGSSRRRSTIAGVVSTFFGPQTGVSTRSVADLHLAAEDENSLRAVVASLPERFPAEKAALRQQHQDRFGAWWAQWRAGHSLLFYGLGSKQSILNDFIRSSTTDGACLAVDGLHPGVTARQILCHVAALAKQTRPGHYRQSRPQDLLTLISGSSSIGGATGNEAAAAAAPGVSSTSTTRDRNEDGLVAVRRMYVMVHNIDGPGLRDASSQRLLSELAALANVHLAASVDHVNAPLLWDLQTRDRFAWTWHAIHTFQPYIQEVAKAAMPSVLAGKKEAASRASALVVLSSMNATAREVFRLVADAQLDPESDGGVPFQRLFQQCRDRFIVSNQMALTAFLTEFKDHQILVTRRGPDGAELLCVPLETEALKHVLTEMEGGR